MGILAWSLIGILVLVGGLIRFVFYPARGAFPPLVLALVVVYLLNPLVTTLARRVGSRVLATLVVYLLFLGVITAIGVNLAPIVSRQVSGFIDRVPEYVKKGALEINQFAEARGSSLRVRVSEAEIVKFVEGHEDTLAGFIGRVRAVGSSVLHVVLTFLLTAVLSFYVLVDLPKIQRAVRNLIPPPRRDELSALGEQLSKALGGFFRGQLLVASFVGVASALGLTLVGLPFAAIIGMISGVFNLVPLIGPFIGAVPAVLIGLLSGDPSLAWKSALVLTVVQQIDNHIVSPNVMGRTVQLSPIAVMLGLLAGGTLVGIPGMLMAVPLIAVVKILGRYLWEHRGRVIHQPQTAAE